MQPLGETSTPQVFSTPCKINMTKEKDYASAIHHYAWAIFMEFQALNINPSKI
jgi:hypothetical protein